MGLSQSCPHGRDPHTELTSARGKPSAARHGFSLYSGPRIDPCSTHRIEKLARYTVRPPIATPRLSLTSSGKVLYKLERPFKDGTHSVLMEPLAFLERLYSQWEGGLRSDPHMPWLDLAAHDCRLNPVWTAAFERRLPK